MMGTVWRDFTFLFMMAFFIMVIWMLPWLNPPASEADELPPGNMIVTITWPEGPTDVDLWLTAPGEPIPVGYSNKAGYVWSLLRDDIGTRVDLTPLNYENAYTRGLPVGEYAINLHCYTCPSTPVDVTVEIEVAVDLARGAVPLYAAMVTLTYSGEEVTVIRFNLDEEGAIVPGSTTQFFQKLRAR